MIKTLKDIENEISKLSNENIREFESLFPCQVRKHIKYIKIDTGVPLFVAYHSIDELSLRWNRFSKLKIYL